MDQNFGKALSESIKATLKQLLTEKHLYQSLEVDISPLELTRQKVKEFLEEADSPFSSTGSKKPSFVDQISKGMECGITLPWVIGGMNIVGSYRYPLWFDLPHINTYCDRCKKTPPFNPISDRCSTSLCPSSDVTQWYTLAYQCQECQKNIVQFLVRRDKLKLRLVGRDPIEAVPPPKVLPKEQSKYFSGALIAHRCGQTLAGIFLLRVFIEQFWRSLPAVQELIRKQPRATGDEQGEVYQDSLPVDFRQRFPSLKKVYGDLSYAMHSADADVALFDQACKDIEEHFDARRVFKLDKAGSGS